MYTADDNMWMLLDVDTRDLGATTDDLLPAGERSYKYFLIHVDDVVVSSHISEQVI